MGEHHGIDEADAARNYRGGEERDRGQDAAPEEYRAGGLDRQVEAQEQPQREQGLHREAAGERIQAEQRCHPVDDAPGRAERSRARFVSPRARRIEAVVQGKRHEARQAVEREHDLHGGLEFQDAPLRKHAGNGGRQCADSRDELPDQAVAREQGRALLGRHCMRQQRLLER